MNSDDRQHTPSSIGPFLFAGEGFESLYFDGMKLVEDVAAYLDGTGRSDCKQLDHDASLLYTGQSMQLTARLMQLASWLLLQRAVREGELTLEEALSDDRRVELGTAMADRSNPAWERLPDEMRELIDKTDSINKRIAALDGMRRGTGTSAADENNPVGAQLDRLRSAFGNTEQK